MTHVRYRWYPWLLYTVLKLKNTGTEVESQVNCLELWYILPHPKPNHFNIGEACLQQTAAYDRVLHPL